MIPSDLATLPTLAGLGIGYALGAIPFGLLFTRIAGFGDVRAIGSGNIGATNVLRTGRKGLAFATLLGDALKGTAAVLIAAQLGEGPALAAGLGAFLGHLFPVWLGFKGGKGVATLIGLLIAFSPAALLAFALVWLGLAFAFKYSSLSALAASAVTPLVLWALGSRRWRCSSSCSDACCGGSTRPTSSALRQAPRGGSARRGERAMDLSDAQRLDWLRLIRTEGIGPRNFRQLINRFGGAAAALDALPDLTQRRGRPVTPPSRMQAEDEVAALARLGGVFLASGDAAYPALLRTADAAPPLIALRGDPAILARPAVAIVGSRNASAAGGAFTDRLARALGEAGLVIVSGLARGIDARAHKASLATGTVAVMAGGHDKIYPANHAALAESILEAGGAVLAEMPMGWQPRAQDFPAATASSPASATAASWWRRRGARARSSPRDTRWSRTARSSPCRARPSTPARRAPTT